MNGKTTKGKSFQTCSLSHFKVAKVFFQKRADMNTFVIKTPMK